MNYAFKVIFYQMENFAELYVLKLFTAILTNTIISL